MGLSGCCALALCLHTLSPHFVGYASSPHFVPTLCRADTEVRCHENGPAEPGGERSAFSSSSSRPRKSRQVSTGIDGYRRERWGEQASSVARTFLSALVAAGRQECLPHTATLLASDSINPPSQALRGDHGSRWGEVALQATITFATEPRAALRWLWAMVRPPLRGYFAAKRQRGAFREPLRGPCHWAAKGQCSAFTLSIASH